MNSFGTRPQSNAGRRTWPYFRFWFEKKGRRYRGYRERGFSAILMFVPDRGTGAARMSAGVAASGGSSFAAR